MAAAVAAHMDVNQHLVGAQESRRAKRYLVLASSTVTWAGSTHIAMIRDISQTGVFVYSNFEPSIGDQLDLVTGSGQGSYQITGMVVRVEAHTMGAAVGFAIKIVTSKAN